MNVPAKTLVMLSTLLLVLVSLIGACGSDDSDDAGETDAGGLSISDVWSRPVALLGDEHEHSDAEATADEDMDMEMGAVNGVVYLTIENIGDSADRLLSASSDVAGAVELHNANMVDGVMRMRQVEGGIEIPADGSVVFEPSGLHVMLIGLTRPLELGETFDVALEFEHAGTMTVQSEVREQP